MWAASEPKRRGGRSEGCFHAFTVEAKVVSSSAEHKRRDSASFIPELAQVGKRQRARGARPLGQGSGQCSPCVSSSERSVIMACIDEEEEAVLQIPAA